MLTKKPLVPNPAFWSNLGAPSPPVQPEAPKPAKKYLSLEEVEAQLLADQRPIEQNPPFGPPQPQPIAPASQRPQHGTQQRYIEESIRPKPQQYQQRQSPHPQFRTPQAQQRLLPHTSIASQGPSQHSTVRELPSRPVSLKGAQPPPNFQEIMAAENQRLLAEDAKRRRRNQKVTEMVLQLVLLN